MRPVLLLGTDLLSVNEIVAACVNHRQLVACKVSSLLLVLSLNGKPHRARHEDVVAAVRWGHVRGVKEVVCLRVGSLQGAEALAAFLGVVRHIAAVGSARLLVVGVQLLHVQTLPSLVVGACLQLRLVGPCSSLGMEVLSQIGNGRLDVASV